MTFQTVPLILTALVFVGRPLSAQDSHFRTLANPAAGVPPLAMPWLPNGATENFIDQMALTSALQATNSWDASTKVTAYRNNQLVGWREHNPAAAAPRFFPDAWDEADHASTLGDLWWGRSKTTHIVVGQESFIRLQAGYPAPKLFLAASAAYHFAGATHATFTGGNGGQGNIEPGNVGGATLELTTSPILHGKLNYTLSVDGNLRSFEIPLMANRKRGDSRSSRPEEQYRLRAAAVVDGADCRCEERPAATAPFSSVLCEFPDSPQEHYELYGAFFGDHASWCAVFYQLEINVPSRNRHGVKVEGIIILKSISNHG